MAMFEFILKIWQRFGRSSSRRCCLRCLEVLATTVMVREGLVKDQPKVFLRIKQDSVFLYLYCDFAAINKELLSSRTITQESS